METKIESPRCSEHQRCQFLRWIALRPVWTEVCGRRFQNCESEAEIPAKAYFSKSLFPFLWWKVYNHGCCLPASSFWVPVTAGKQWVGPLRGASALHCGRWRFPPVWPLKYPSSSSVRFPTPSPLVRTQNKRQPAAKLRGSRWFHMSYACPNNPTHTGALMSERNTSRQVAMAMVDRAVCVCNAPLFMWLRFQTVVQVPLFYIFANKGCW